jgi:hypothetical protein
MTRPRLARFALLLLVSGGLAPPRVEALDPPSVYIQRYEFETDYPYEKGLINQEITHLNTLFKALSTVDARAQAVYAIHSTRFELHHEELKFIADFLVHSDSAPLELTDLSGKGKSPHPKMRVATALNDYLDQTLFNPAVGPYPQLLIETCSDKSGRLVLTTRWTDRLEEFEHEFTFEVGPYDKTFDEYSGTGVFLEIDNWKVTGSTAVLKPWNVVTEDGNAVKETCSDTGLGHDLKQDPRYLLMRIYTPEQTGAGGDGHGLYVGQ